MLRKRGHTSSDQICIRALYFGSSHSLGAYIPRLGLFYVVIGNILRTR